MDTMEKTMAEDGIVKRPRSQTEKASDSQVEDCGLESHSACFKFH